LLNVAVSGAKRRRVPKESERCFPLPQKDAFGVSNAEEVVTTRNKERRWEMGIENGTGGDGRRGA